MGISSLDFLSLRTRYLSHTCFCSLFLSTCLLLAQFQNPFNSNVPHYRNFTSGSTSLSLPKFQIRFCPRAKNRKTFKLYAIYIKWFQSTEQNDARKKYFKQHLLKHQSKFKIISHEYSHIKVEYDQEIPLSHTADQPTAVIGRATDVALSLGAVRYLMKVYVDQF